MAASPEVPSLASHSDGGSSASSVGVLTPEFRPSVHPFSVEGAAHLGFNTSSLWDRKAYNLDALIPPLKAAYLRPGDVPQVGNICFIGAGYVGGPTASVLALHNPNIRVEVVDRDQNRIQRWKSSHLPIHEPGLSNVVRVARDGAQADYNDVSLNRQPNLFFTTEVEASIAKADIVFIAVNTPTKAFGVGAGRATNMAAFDSCVATIAAHARPGTIIVEKSTVPCGTARRIRSRLQSLRPDVHFEILSNPEFLAEGSAIENLMKPDRVIIGSSNTPSGQHAAAVLANVYASWVPRSQILESNVWSSELTKLVANAMLAQRISSINSISAICEQTGADVDEVARGIGCDPRIGPQFLKAGLGFGGSCFRKDIASLTYLAESLGLDDVADYWDSVNRINVNQRRRFARRVIRRLDDNLIGKKVAILGFAFKKNTGDARESLAVDVVRSLLEEKPAEVAIYDPFCNKPDIVRELELACASLQNNGNDGYGQVYDDPYEACAGANAVLVLTDHPQFFVRRGTKTVAETLRLSLPRHFSHIFTEQPRQEVFTVGDVTFHLHAQPLCESCTECTQPTTISSSSSKSQPSLDWTKIVSGMRQPRYLFDSRGVLDQSLVEDLRLDVCFEAIGKAPRNFLDLEKEKEHGERERGYFQALERDE